MCTTLKNKKIDVFCYVLDKMTVGEIIEETNIDKNNLIYADVKCECGNIHPIVTNKNSNKG